MLRCMDLLCVRSSSCVQCCSMHGDDERARDVLWWCVGHSCRDMFNKETINKMKDGAWLVNTARGAIVNKDDVAEALKSGKLAGMELFLGASMTTCHCE